MKASFVKWMVAGIVISLVLPALASAQAQSIVGNYALSREGDMAGKVVGYMRISQQNGNKFSIGIASPTGNPAQDWQGNGVINGTNGYYDWVFKDGKKGRTTFIIDKSGNLHGQVRGSGLNWDYVARRR